MSKIFLALLLLLSFTVLPLKASFAQTDFSGTSADQNSVAQATTEDSGAAQDAAVEATTEDSGTAQEATAEVSAEDASTVQEESDETTSEDADTVQEESDEATSEDASTAPEATAEATTESADTAQEATVEATTEGAGTAPEATVEAVVEGAGTVPEATVGAAVEGTGTAPEATVETTTEGAVAVQNATAQDTAIDDHRLHQIDNFLTNTKETRDSEIRRKPYDTGIASSTYNPAYTTAQNDPKPGSNLPGWIQRTWFGAIIQSSEAPKYYLETVQPLYQSPSDENTIFTQGRVSVYENNQDYSLGVGYRRLLMENNLMLGINDFFDYTSVNNHYRTGIGLEAITNALEFRANSYIRLSPKRFFYADATQRLYDQAVNGYDVEIGGPLNFGWLKGMAMDFNSPNWLKVYAGYYWYDYRRSDNVNGLKFRLEVKPVQGFALNLSTFNDNLGPQQYQGDVRINLQIMDFRPKTLIAALHDVTAPSTPPGLETRTLDRVERNFVIQVEHPPVKKGQTLVGLLSNVQLVVRFPGENPVTTDFNGNGKVDPGEDFELDVLMTNNTDHTSTGISYANAIMDNDSMRIRINTGAYLPDAPPHGTTRTDNDTDMDPSFYATDPIGKQLFVTLDFTADGETKTLTFGPFVVGSVYNNQIINVVN